VTEVGVAGGRGRQFDTRLV